MVYWLRLACLALLLAALPCPAQAQETDEPGMAQPTPPPAPADQPTPPPPVAPPATDQPPPVPMDELKRALARRLTHPQFEVREASLRACSHTRNAACVPGLTAMLTTEQEANTRADAALALGRIGDRRAVPYLKAAHWGDDDPVVREAAWESLKQMGRTVRPGPYWEWQEYKKAKSHRNAGLVVLAGGGGAGLIIALVSTLVGMGCSLESLGFNDNDCDDAWNAAVAGVAIAAAGGLIGAVTLASGSSKLRAATPKPPKPLSDRQLPGPPGPRGARLSWRWRF